MNKFKAVKIAACTVLAAALALFFITEYAGGRQSNFMTFMTVGAVIPFDANSGASFYAPGGKGFFFASRDGITYYTEDGSIQMSELFTMQNPMLYGEGQIAGVVEHGGYDAYVFNTQRLLYHHSFSNPIVNFTVNEMGFSCVVTKRGDGYVSYVYNHNGHLILEKVEPNNVLVISTAISRDGRIWATAYLDVGGVQYNSFISFRYLNRSEAAPFNDDIFASLRGENIPELNNQFFGIMRYMDGNNLVVVTDKSVFCIQESQPSRASWVVPLDNELDHVRFHGGHVALAMGRGLLNRLAEPVGRVALLDMGGERVLEYDTGEKVQNLSLSSHGIIIGAGGRFDAINTRGQELWGFDADYDARGAVFLDANDKILLYSNTQASVMKQVRVSGNRGDNGIE